MTETADRATGGASPEAIQAHYDVGNGFYRLWLDPTLTYSCALWAGADDTLEAAQLRKLDWIAEPALQRHAKRVLDIGCGWGGLVMHAARTYGVDATGITLSAPQAELANRLIAEAGLEGRCRVLVQDYREVPEDAPWDTLVSVGMFEHVGHEMLPAYFQKAGRILKRGGVFLNHGIAANAADPGTHGPNFSDTYVFPDGETVPVSTTLRVAEGAGFEVRDVESLREHYALTLRHWVSRLEAHHDQAMAFVDEPTWRVWRLYMAGSAHGFVSRRLNVYQTLLAWPGPDGASGLPLTRNDWYPPTAR